MERAPWSIAIGGAVVGAADGLNHHRAVRNPKLLNDLHTDFYKCTVHAAQAEFIICNIQTFWSAVYSFHCFTLLSQRQIARLTTSSASTIHAACGQAGMDRKILANHKQHILRHPAPEWPSPHPG